MKRKLFDSKVNLSIIASLFFLMILGCESAGGELLPIGGDGVEIASSRFENDTAQINDNGVRMKLYGGWDGRAKIRVVIENNSENSIKVDFKQSTILDSKGENQSIDSVYEDKGDAINQIKDKEFSVAANGKHKLVIGFPLYLMNSLDEEPPRIISIVLGVETNFKTKELRKYKFDFKGIQKRDLSGKSDPSDW